MLLTLMVSQRPKLPMVFCERAFGVFFVLWGIVLILDQVFITAHRGLFYGRMESYMPGWCWGLLLSSVGISRWLAFRFQSNQWRIRLSMLTLVILTVITALAFASRLYAATFPLTAFVTYMSFWCHSALRRDINLGL